MLNYDETDGSLVFYSQISRRRERSSRLIMSVAATIPPELFEHVLWHVCSSDSLSEDCESTARREAIVHLAACSLTCVYWTQVCRPRIFRYIWIRSFNELRTLLSLVLIGTTLSRLRPISQLIFRANCVQRLGDRPWLHNLRLLTYRHITGDYAQLHLHIIGHSSHHHAIGSLASSPSPLLVGLPRTLPSIFHSCNTLTLRELHFQNPNDLRRCLSQFSAWREVNLEGITLHNPNRFREAVLSRPLKVLRGEGAIHAKNCSQSVTLAWTAFTFLEHIRTSWSQAVVIALLHPTNFQVAVNISEIIFQGIVSSQLHSPPTCTIYNISRGTVHLDETDTTYGEKGLFCRPYETLLIGSVDRLLLFYFKPRQHSPKMLGGHNTLDLKFFAYSNRKPGDRRSTAHPSHISYNAILIHSQCWSDIYNRCLTNDEVELLDVLLTCPWDRLVDQFLLLPPTVLSRVRVQCPSHNSLVRLIQEHRASLAKLGDRLELVYETDGPVFDWELKQWVCRGVAVGIDSLEDIGGVVFRERYSYA